jgi:3',5'-cyclic AMP phosphodiesterase CpdA
LLFLSAYAQDDALWIRRYNGNGGLHDYAKAIALDNSGAVVVVGKTWSEQGNYDFLTLKYSSDGVFQWSKTFDGGAGADDSAMSVSVSRQGDIFVGGISTSSGGDMDFLLIKYSPDGEKVWTRRYDAGDNDQLAEVATDIFGNVIVTGSSKGGNGYDYTTIKYSSSGSQLWLKRYNANGSKSDYAYALSVDREGNIYITGSSSHRYNFSDYQTIGTIKYGSDGTLLWAKHRWEYEPCAGLDVTSDDAGNVYVTGHEWSFSGYQKSNYVTIKYNSSGAAIWTRLYNGPVSSYDKGRKIAVDKIGNAYVTGESFSGSSYDIMTIEYDPVGTVVGSHRFDGPISDQDYASDMIRVGSDSVFVVGTSVGNGSSSDIVSILYDGQCNVYSTWPRRFNGEANLADRGVAAAADASGMYVAGSSDGGATFFDVVIIKYKVTPSPPGAVAGTVSNSADGVPLPDALVRLLDNSSEIGTDVTDLTGAYLIPTIGAGVYDVEVSKSDFYAKMQSGVEVIAGQTTVVDFQLTPEPAETPYFVHLTDTHYGDWGAKNKLCSILDRLAALVPKPRFVIVSGDILTYGAHSSQVCTWPPPSSMFCYTWNPAENSYGLFNDDLNNKLYAKGIPYYVAPGNHDYYFAPCVSVSLDNYLAQFENEDYEVPNSDPRLVSLNSGSDYVCAARGSGLDDQQMLWLGERLDLLDGVSNGIDLSGFRKVIFMHHPVINYEYGEWKTGTIIRNRTELMDTCNQYGVDLVLTGHTHEGRAFAEVMDGVSGYEMGYPDAAYPISTTSRTLYVQTGSAMEGYYRKIEMYPDHLLVYPEASIENNVKLVLGSGGGSSWKSSDGKRDSIGCPARLHLYDVAGNHVGVNDTSGIDMEISGTVYSLKPAGIIPGSDSLSWEMSIEEISSFIDPAIDPAGFTFEIRGSAEGSAFLTIEKITTEGGHESAYYDSVMVTALSVGHLYVLGDSIDYGIRFDDNDDGIVDRVVQPDEISLPDFICGDANGDAAVDIADAVYLIAYIFSGGPAPNPLAAGDANCDGEVDIADVVYLVNYIFSGGAAPCAVCK